MNDDRYPNDKHPDHKSNKQEPVMSKQSDVVEVLGAGTYYPLCKMSDGAARYLYAAVSTICLTAIVLLLVFSFVTLPILING